VNRSKIHCRLLAMKPSHRSQPTSADQQIGYTNAHSVDCTGSALHARASDLFDYCAVTLLRGLCGRSE
jgi:hypothetical protein